MTFVRYLLQFLSQHFQPRRGIAEEHCNHEIHRDTESSLQDGEYLQNVKNNSSVGSFGRKRIPCFHWKVYRQEQRAAGKSDCCQNIRHSNKGIKARVTIYIFLYNMPLMQLGMFEKVFQVS